MIRMYWKEGWGECVRGENVWKMKGVEEKMVKVEKD